MALATATLTTGTEFAGAKKLITLLVPISTADDTFTLTTAVHGITSLDSIVGCTIAAGNAYGFSRVVPTIVSASGMSINVLSYNSASSVATTFGNSAISLAVLGNV